jgi:hypothetical protein
MFTIRMSEISEVAGNASDGVVRGVVAQSLFTGYNNNFEWQDTVYAIREELISGSLVFTDISADAMSDIPDQCLPWGTDGTFSAGSALYIASDDLPLTELRVDITTPGAWTGTGLAVYDSDDGLTANRLLTVTSDLSNGFRNGPDIFAVVWAPPPTPGRYFSPVPGSFTARDFIRVVPVALSAETIAPKMSRIYTLHGFQNAPYVDFTAILNAPMNDGTFGPFPNVLPFVGSVALFTFGAIPMGMDFNMYRRVQGTPPSGVFEYLSSSNVWQPLQNVTDGTNAFSVGPSVLGNPPVFCMDRWSVPADWTPKTLTFPRVGGGTNTVTGYQMRYRVTAINVIAPVLPSLARGRTLQLAPAYASGVYHYAAGSYTGLTFEVGVPGASDVHVQVANVNTGQAAMFTIPAGVRSSAEITGHRLDLSETLQVAIGEMIVISWVAGSSVQDVELVLQ